MKTINEIRQVLGNRTIKIWGVPESINNCSDQQTLVAYLKKISLCSFATSYVPALNTTYNHQFCNYQQL